jgi:hypothetical protein
MQSWDRSWTARYPSHRCSAAEGRSSWSSWGPTIKNEGQRAKIRVVLNLDRPRGSLRRYLMRLCQGLGLELDRHVYATNYVKCFFVQPPTRI